MFSLEIYHIVLRPETQLLPNVIVFGVAAISMRPPEVVMLLFSCTAFLVLPENQLDFPGGYVLGVSIPQIGEIHKK
ncbi:MAG: hypothetical protein ACOH1I_02580 [Gallionellaceae bacterium]